MSLTIFAPVNGGNVAAVRPFPTSPGDVNKTVLDPYIWRGLSTTGGGFSTNEALWQWILAKPARVQALRNAVAERQDLRRFALGEMWIHSPVMGGAPVELTDPTKWAVWQLHDTASRSGAATLIRRPQATEPSFTLRLRGLAGGAGRWNVSWAFGFVVERHQVMSREELAALRVALPQRNTSVVVRYQVLGSDS